MVVYRVQQCACCVEMEEMADEPVILVNLLLMRPCIRRAGTVWTLPEGDLAVTMEIQVCVCTCVLVSGVLASYQRNAVGSEYSTVHICTVHM